MTQAISGYQALAIQNHTFLEIVMAYNQQYAPEAGIERQIQPPSGEEFPWIMVSYTSDEVRKQGWKIHIAACDASAEQVLHSVLPLLLSEIIPFKVLNSLQDLERLNSGQAGLSQIGKFLTIYPRDDNEAVRLAALLDTVTDGLPAPSIPSDRPLRPDSLVFYRYGSFQPEIIQTAWGTFQSVIQTPEEEFIPDPRSSVYAPPDWAVDPFLAAGVAEELDEQHLLIANRYLLLTTIYRSAHSQIHLAIDLLTPRSCVVKSPGLAFIRGGNDTICSFLRTEAQVLAALAPHPVPPACYDLREVYGEVYLVLEDIEGETLAQHVQQRYTALGYKFPPECLLAWAQELASMLHTIHTKGWAYRDLKASNLIVTPDGHLRLIDFGLAQPLSNEATGGHREGFGTFGYMSPQQQRGEPATISDDIYSLGALLYLLATGAEPSLAPRDVPLTVRPLRHLNPMLDPALAALIERCLHPDPDKRFASAAEIERELSALSTRASNIPSVELRVEEISISDRSRQERWRADARRLGETLSQAASSDPQGTGMRWTSTHHAGKGRQSRDLSSGSSGSLLALADVVAEFDDLQQRQILAEGARWLSTAPHQYKPLPGLYVGEAGVGTALLRAGKVLNDSALLELAVQHSHLIATLPFASPDLFNGTAGRVRFHLWLWDATSDAFQLQAALHAGEAILSAAEQVSSTETCWRIPAGYSSMSGEIFLGFAHGAAGIADVLLDLYEETSQERFLTAGVGAARWLKRLAVPTLDDASGVGWPEKEGGQIRGAYWCHGATGIGSFFLHAAQLGVFADAMELAERAARSVAYGNRACNPVQCHGLSGNIEFLLDMAQFTKKQQYWTAAWDLAALLEAFAVEKDGMLIWPSESPATFTPDYLVGYAGILVTLLRLADRERPHRLSRKGLNYLKH